MTKSSPLILAIDSTDIEKVRRLIDETREFISIYKFGLEFYLSHGLERLDSLKSSESIEVFLDLKLHDIPNTVRKAAEAISSLRPKILTVHSAGGGEMVRAAVHALPDTSIAAVTILTSLDQEALIGLGIERNLSELVLSFASSALTAGAAALVASPHEVGELRARFPEAILITPGIRPLDLGDDQRRTMTPRQAIDAGSDYLVIGRPISSSASPRDSAKEILASIGEI